MKHLKRFAIGLVWTLIVVLLSCIGLGVILGVAWLVIRATWIILVAGIIAFVYYMGYENEHDWPFK